MSNNAERQRKSVIIGLAITAAKRLFLETKYESSAEEDDKVETGVKLRKKRKYQRRSEAFIEHMLHGATARQFQMHFRIPLTTFELLLPKVDMYLKKQCVLGRSKVSTTKNLLATIWVLATSDSYSSISIKLDMGKSSLFKSFVTCIKALNKVAPLEIKWPSEEEMPAIADNMFEIAGVDNVVGVIDSTFVPIKAPSKDPHDYITKKCNHAITLQAVCVRNLKFTDCFVGYPGSVPDARIFMNSDLFINICKKKASYFYNNEYFIIGDEAYPVLDWCIAPYVDRGNLTEAQKYFNASLCQTQEVTRRAFALLFGRFRRLKYLDMNRTDLIPEAILAACVIHNMCLDSEDLEIEEYIQQGLNNVNGNENYSDYEIDEDDDIDVRSGHLKRNKLCQDLYEVRE